MTIRIEILPVHIEESSLNAFKKNLSADENNFLTPPSNFSQNYIP
jgi:hypothetical protein